MKVPKVTWKTRLLAEMYANKKTLREAMRICRISSDTLAKARRSDPAFDAEVTTLVFGEPEESWEPATIEELLKGIQGIAFAHIDNPSDADELQLKAMVRLGEIVHPQVFGKSNEHHHTATILGGVVVQHELSAAESIRREMLDNHEYLDAIRASQIDDPTVIDAGPVRENGGEGAVETGEAPGGPGSGTC